MKNSAQGNSLIYGGHSKQAIRDIKGKGTSRYIQIN
jgi:hypothetical protein